MKGLDCYFKKVNEYSILIEDIQAISQHKKMKNVYGVKYSKKYIQFGSIEHENEITMIIMKLK